MKVQDFPRFTDIDHAPLRVYNRSVMYHNILEDHGAATAAEYINSFSPEARLQVAQMTALVRKKGVKYVSALVTSGLTFVDEEYVEELTNAGN